MRLTTIVLVASLLLGGCAVPYADVMKSLEAAGTCCTTMAEFSFLPISPGQTLKVEVNAASPAFLFPSGKSYFAALALPPFSSPYRVSIESYMLGEHIDKAYLFVPQVLILDKEYRVARASSVEDFRLTKTAPLETWGLPYKLVGAVAISADNSEDRYLVIMTTRELLDGRTSITTRKVIPVILPGVVSAIPGGKEEKLVPHAPVGNLKVRLEQVSQESGIPR